LMILEVFSNLHDSMILFYDSVCRGLSFKIYHYQSHPLHGGENDNTKYTTLAEITVIARMSAGLPRRLQ